MSAEVPSGWEKLYSEEEIQAAVQDLVQRLLQIDGIRSNPVTLIQVLEGARVFAGMISKHLKVAGVDVTLVDVGASSYNDGPQQQGELTVSGTENVSIEDGSVLLLVDDLIDTGKTMRVLLDEIRALAGDNPVFSVVLIEKLAFADFVAIPELTDKWIAGVGINGNDTENLGPNDGRDVPFLISKILA